MFKHALMTLAMTILLTGATRAELGKGKPKGDKSTDPAGAAKAVTEAEVNDKLGKIGFGNDANNLFALGWFETRTPPPNKELQNKVAEKLMEIVEKGEALAVGRALKALPNWATPEIGPRLLEKMRAGGGGQYYLILAVANVKYEKALPTLLRYLETGEQRDQVTKALSLWGPAAETGVIKVLSDIDYSKRLAGPQTATVRQGVRVLLKIGTKESLPILETVKTVTTPKNKTPNNELNNLAVNAIEAIQERIQAGKSDKK